MEMLDYLINLSITGTIILLVFLLLKPLTKNHFSSTWHYKLLILILAFFVIPVGSFVKLPTVAIANIPNPVSEGFKALENPKPIEAVKEAESNNGLVDNNFRGETNVNLQNQATYSPQTEVQNRQDLKFKPFPFKELIKYTWLIGALALLLIKIGHYTRFRFYILQHSTAMEKADIVALFDQCRGELKIKKQIPLRISSCVESPMLVGVLRPMVLLPGIGEDHKGLKMIFLHELNHFKRNDILVKLMGLIIGTLHWFNPFIHLLLREMNQFCEYSIDEKVVATMDIKDRKYYGETILSSIGSNRLGKPSLSTSMGDGGRQLKIRLEKMIYSEKASGKKRVLSVLMGMFILVTGFTVACGVAPVQVKDKNDSIAVYIKDDGLYYSPLTGGNEVKIQEGQNFEYPLISKEGSYIAYTKANSLFIYNIKEGDYEQIADGIEHYYNSYSWFDNETLIYGSSKEPGFKVLNVLSKEIKEHLDEYYYVGLVASKNTLVYGSRLNRWSNENGEFMSNDGVVEIDLKQYDSDNNKFSVKVVVEGRQSTLEAIGYNPIVWDVSADGKLVYIMEKPASGSLSSDGISIGIYDVEAKTHAVLQDLTTLSYKNHLALNPKSKLIGLIVGAGRDMIENKEVVALEVDRSGSYQTINFMDQKLVAMTPSFTLDGKKILYSATKAAEDLPGASVHEVWNQKAHHIYEYDLETKKIKQLTVGENFDFLPLQVANNELLFVRYKGGDFYSLIKLADGQEEIVADNIKFSGGSDNGDFGFYGHIDTERGMDVFIN